MLAPIQHNFQPYRKPSGLQYLEVCRIISADLKNSSKSCKRNSHVTNEYGDNDENRAKRKMSERLRSQEESHEEIR
ncbi:hypothetical protein PCASD_14456 [Puccinia coronata f. sp. avenae]|uniref:Uncharacterized protein n=1 Tax=Puccinia coronata f. sp. avenae TaxID=200324 RepID=A0A2N5UDR1_9BASI|nr:hypothetical protein PCASD_14456 [Puccinia coronata f. sp. avenae]